MLSEHSCMKQNMEEFCGWFPAQRRVTYKNIKKNKTFKNFVDGFPPKHVPGKGTKTVPLEETCAIAFLSIFSPPSRSRLLPLLRFWARRLSERRINARRLYARRLYARRLSDRRLNAGRLYARRLNPLQSSLVAAALVSAALVAAALVAAALVTAALVAAALAAAALVAPLLVAPAFAAPASAALTFAAAALAAAAAAVLTASAPDASVPWTALLSTARGSPLPHPTALHHHTAAPQHRSTAPCAASSLCSTPQEYRAVAANCSTPFKETFSLCSRALPPLPLPSSRNPALNTLSAMVQGSPILACVQRAHVNAARRAEGNSSEQSAAGCHEASNSVVVAEHGEHDSIDGIHTNGKSSHALHHVLPICTRASIVRWMVQEASSNGDRNICSKAVRQFPQFFRASSCANNMRALRLWRSRSSFENDAGVISQRGSSAVVTRVTKAGVKVARLKARNGRGRKRGPWVEALHQSVKDEFERLSKLGVKFNLNTLKHLALDILSTGDGDSYSRNMIDPRSNEPLHLKITSTWIQSFTNRFRITSRAHTGKHRMSPRKEEKIELTVAAHLGRMSGLFESHIIDENNIENADETHFVINVDNSRTLGFCGTSEVMYADVVSGGEGFTMIVRLSGGRDSKVEAPFLVFKNKDRHYPIRGVPDNVDGVAYRTGPKGWIDTTVMPQWLSEQRVIRPLPHDRLRVLYVDNCSGHTNTMELQKACDGIKTQIKYFPPNATHLVQPCDSFVIQKIKRAWSTEWETYKMQMIKLNKWKDSSGKIANPGKTYFLRLAARCVRKVNEQRDADGLRYARKAMIITGMALNTNGLWEVSQLTPDLQRIVRKHASVFDASRNEAMSRDSLADDGTAGISSETNGPHVSGILDN